MLAYLNLASAMMIVALRRFLENCWWRVASVPAGVVAFLASQLWRWRTGCRVAPMSRRWTARSRGLLFLESFLGNFCSSICMLFGMRAEATAISAGVIMAGIPAAVALLSWLFLRETLSRLHAGHRAGGRRHRRAGFHRAGSDDAHPPRRSAWCCWLAVFARRAMW